MARKGRLPPSEEQIEASTQPKSELKEFLAGQDKTTLIDVLAELADSNELVRQRLERLQLSTEPRKLSAAFKRILSTWRAMLATSTDVATNRCAGQWARFRTLLTLCYFFSRHS